MNLKKKKKKKKKKKNFFTKQRDFKFFLKMFYKEKKKIEIANNQKPTLIKIQKMQRVFHFFFFLLCLLPLFFSQTSTPFDFSLFDFFKFSTTPQMIT